MSSTRIQPACVELPPEFDAGFYQRENDDLAALTDAELAEHYRRCGLREGRVASLAATRCGFVGLLRDVGSVLEIGPLSRPALTGPNVRYFDVLTTDELRKKAEQHGLDPDGCPHIDFVSKTADLAIVPPGFDAVFSSHVVEHQPDLVRHFEAISRILAVGGRYFLAIPDKRFCFDHFMPESSIADVLGAHVSKRVVHTAESHIRQAALITHNDPQRHWGQDHGEPIWRSKPANVRAGMLKALQAQKDEYVDSHAWQFTPTSFREIVELLFAEGLSNLCLRRIYSTRRDAIEFYAILEKDREGDIGIAQEIPQDFEGKLYLMANPDVAEAGADPLTHYEMHGRREGRRLRP